MRHKTHAGMAGMSDGRWLGVVDRDRDDPSLNPHSLKHIF